MDSTLSIAPRFRPQVRRVRFFRIAELRKIASCEQVAAVCYRVNGHGIEFLLVQTRGRRWTFPKGSSEPGLTHAQTAALEAFEEAGVHGRMEEDSFARYFRRAGSPSKSRPRKIAVNAHLCEVTCLESPPERKRTPTWFSPEETKRRLREDRASGDGAELARVVARALERIQSMTSVMDSAEQLVIQAELPRRLLRARNK